MTQRPDSTVSSEQKHSPMYKTVTYIEPPDFAEDVEEIERQMEAHNAACLRILREGKKDLI
jgi:hypothetical protein